MLRKKLLSSSTLCVILIAIGIFLRLNNYLEDKALWVDEALHAFDIVSRSFSEIIQGQNFVVSNPIGFALITKIFVQLLGHNEYILRLFPFISSIVTLFLFYILLKKTLSPKAVPFTLSLFIFCKPLIYFATETKHFMLDVLATLIIYLAFKKLHPKEPTYKQTITLGLIGGLTLWFSFSAIFILTSIMTCFFIRYLFLSAEERTAQLKIFFAFPIWVLNFGIIYKLFIQKKSSIKGLTQMWEGAFWPFPPWSLESLSWLKNSIWNMFTYPLGETFGFISITLFIWGGYLLFKKSRFNFSILILPFFITLTASILKLYPFHDRMLLFLIPIIFLFIGESLAFFLKKNKISKLSGTLIFILLLFHPLKTSLSNLLNPSPSKDIRPIMQYLKSHQQKNDYLYMTASTYMIYNYYAKRYNFKFQGTIAGVLSEIFREENNISFLYIHNIPYKIKNKLLINGTLSAGNINPQNHKLTRLEESKRTWILCLGFKPKVETFFLQHLNHIGIKKWELKKGSSSLYLYDLSP